jgi:outer membrane protein assembly factor BamB
VVVSSSDGELVILDGQDGRELRRVDAGGPVNRSPAIADGVVYVVADNGVATAFELASGRVRWQTDLAVDDPEPLTSPEALTPVFANDTVYVTRGSLDKAIPHEVVAIDAVSGAVDWRWSSPTFDRLFIGAVTPDTVYTVGEDGAVRAFDPDGTRPRQLAQAGGALGSPASIVDDTFYVGSADGLMHALDRASGTERWSVAIDGIPTMPVVADGRVHIGTSLGHAVTIADPS